MMKAENRKDVFVTILFMVFAGALSCLSIIYHFTDLDFYWHLKVGEQIVGSGIPTTDSFSWISEISPLPFTAHEWLFDVMMYVLWALLGKGPAEIPALIYSFITAALTVFVIRKLIFKNGFDLWKGCFTVLVAFFLTDNPRPGNLSSILMIASLYVIFQNIRNHKHIGVCFLPVMSCIWVNIHGGTVLMLFALYGLIVMLGLIFLIFKDKIKIDAIVDNTVSIKKYLVKHIAILALSTGCSLLNPYGYRSVFFGILNSDSGTHKYIGEWNHGTIIYFPFLVCMTVMILYLIIKRGKIDFVTFIPFVLMSVFIGIWLRMSNYAVICGLFLIKDIWDSKPAKQNKYLFMYLACFIIIIGYLIGIQLKEYSSIYKFPKELENILVEKKYQRMYNDYSTGAKLIMLDMRDFIDARGDPFVGDIVLDGIEFQINDMSSDTEYTDNYLDIWGFDALLLPGSTNKELVKKIKEDLDWELIYDDETNAPEDYKNPTYFLFEYVGDKIPDDQKVIDRYFSEKE